jgi:hypothetical protein
VPSRKRNSHKRKGHRQGVSGNPQRRAEQLLEEQRSAQARAARQLSWEPHASSDLSPFREMAYRLAGGASAEVWWRESHGRILERARGLAWPSRLVDLETQTCRIVGDEFYDRLQSQETGLHPVQWLRILAEETGAALRAALTQGNDDWQKLWALLRGLVLTTPRMLAEAASETDVRLREEFPDIKDPYETALAEAGQVAGLLANRGLETGVGLLADGPRPAGEPLLARDGYGSRFLLAAPFGYDEGTADHWYAWDIDLCWLDVVVGAGAFASADDALREWRDAVGPAASGAVLSQCAPGLTTQLLAPCLETGFTAYMLQGHEPRELIREYYRLRRRARDLAGSAEAGAGSSPFETEHAGDAFLAWYAARHNDSAEIAAEDAGTLLAEWGSQEPPDGRSFYACSPHRIEMAAHLIRDGYFTDYANAALRLLPEWVEWCIEHSGLGSDMAARSREAARSAAAPLADDEEAPPPAEDDKGPFRRQE